MSKHVAHTYEVEQTEKNYFCFSHLDIIVLKTNDFYCTKCINSDKKSNYKHKIVSLS